MNGLEICGVKTSVSDRVYENDEQNARTNRDVVDERIEGDTASELRTQR